MGSDDLFEAVSHPMRIEIVKALAEKPLRFADLKRALKADAGLLVNYVPKLAAVADCPGSGRQHLSPRLVRS